MKIEDLKRIKLKEVFPLLPKWSTSEEINFINGIGSFNDEGFKNKSDHEKLCIKERLLTKYIEALSLRKKWDRLHKENITLFANKTLSLIRKELEEK